MAIHVNVAEAKARLSALLDAALRGEDVVLQKGGVPKAKIVPIEAAEHAARAEVARRRVANIGVFREKYRGVDLTVPPSMTESELEERYRRKFSATAD